MLPIFADSRGLTVRTQRPAFEVERLELARIFDLDQVCLEVQWKPDSLHHKIRGPQMAQGLAALDEGSRQRGLKGHFGRFFGAHLSAHPVFIRLSDCFGAVLFLPETA